MRDLSPDDRPREKLQCHGPAALGDNELVALVLGSGSGRRNALTLANDLLAAHDGLRGLARCGCGDLVRMNGVGQARAARIVAAIELGRRTLAFAPSEKRRIDGPGAAAAYLLPRFGARSVETFGILILDTRHRVLRTAVLAIGALNATGVLPREVYREAAMSGACAIIAFHNHPSGDPAPSPDDVELTRRLMAAGALMGIDLVDHLILADARYYSFKESQRL